MLNAVPAKLSIYNIRVVSYDIQFFDRPSHSAEFELEETVSDDLGRYICTSSRRLAHRSRRYVPKRRRWSGRERGGRWGR